MALPYSRPRPCPDAALADRAYGSKGGREYLRSRGIWAVIPEKKDQIASRKRRISKGGRPPAFDAGAYRNRNFVERSFAYVKAMARVSDEIRQARYHLPGGSRDQRDPDMAPLIKETCPSTVRIAF